MTQAYNFPRGHVLARKYEVLQQLRSGRLGELYQLSERVTGIERTAKFFIPSFNGGGRLAHTYAMKLHKLRNCDILMPYRTHETFSHQGKEVTFLVSDLVEGELLAKFLAAEPGGHLGPFEGLHLLHSLASGVEKMHLAGEHHGDLTTGNIMVRRHGLHFRVKLIDLDPLHVAKPAMIKQDVAELIALFAEVTAWRRLSLRQPKVIRNAVTSLKQAFIGGKLKHAGDLKHHLENLNWT